MPLRRILGAGGGVLLVAVLAYYSFRPQPVVVEIGAVEQRTVREFVAEEAKTRLADEYLIDMPDAGLLERMTLEVGDEVREGDVVARMDTFPLEQELAAIEGRIRQAEAQIRGVDVQKPKDEDLASADVRVKEAEDAIAIAERELEVARGEADKAHKEFERVRGLLDEGIASPSDFDRAEQAHLSARQNARAAELALESARKNRELARLAESRVTGSVDDNEYVREVYQAEIDSLRAQAEIIRDRIAKAAIRSPVSGPVLERYEEDSRTLPPGAPLLRIGDMASAEIECDVLSEEVVRIEAGDPVELYGKAVQSEYSAGTVKQVFPSAFTKISSLGIEQQRVRVLIEYDRENLALRPGTRLDVRIITDESEDTVAVPERATFRHDGRPYVFKDEGGTAALTPVTLGLKNDTWAEILDGLEPGDRIVYEPANDLEDGSAIVAK